MTTTPFTPDVAAVAAGLANDPVYVDPSVADQITPEQLTAIHASIDASATPVHIIAVPLTLDSPVTPVQLVSLVHRQLPEDGIWYVARQSFNETWDVEATTYNVSIGNDANLAGYAASELYPADLGLQLQKVTDLIATGTAEEVYRSMHPDDAQRTTSTTQQDDGAQLLGVDLPYALTGVGMLAVVVALVALRRRPGARHEIAIKNRALRRISTAQTDSWRHRAQDEAAKLGDRINSLQITDGSDRDAWTAALDHYEAATRVLDRTTSAADSIGALVLARRGEDALTHAVDGRPWEPTAVCFFNPLHGAATTTVRWETSAGARDVPACADCRRLARKKKEPDFLDLPVGGSVVHYIDADKDAEPWASTGYGSLDPDLLARVREI